MANIKEFDVIIGQVLNNGIPCPNPIVELAGQRGLALPCKDPTTGCYTVQVPEGEEGCLTFIIRCGDCHSCPPIIKEICFCDNIDQCPDCHICVGGVCEPICSPGQICDDGVCRDCLSDDQCPCTQVCVQGSCGCPVGTTLNPLTECCDACNSDEDCGLCFVCENGICVPLECPSGVCDPTTGACVGCLSTSDCTGANECCENNTCACCPGFVRDSNGICQPAPDCTTDAQCLLIDPCLRCENGRCVPQQCPPGEIAVNINGVCECRERCDCVNGGCSRTSDFCSEIRPNECACLPCEGSCDTGCLDPCFCNPTTNQCEFNPCANVPCQTGLDCPETCGCLDGQCVPCVTLPCPDICEDALGCECVGGNCVPDPCRGDCSTSFDCAQGCTCFQGQCVSCDNFTCEPIDNCTVQVGCQCLSGDCVPGEKECTDTLEIIKDDSNCSITGRLEKESCCSCPALTLDVIGSSNGGGSYTFTAELRKGSFDGVNAQGNPRVDDFANDNIAENEPPTSGVIAFTSEITYNNYSGGAFTGTSVEPGPTGSASFPASGDQGAVDFNVALPPIGQIIGDKEAVSYVLTFSQSSTLRFPNGCEYDGGVSIGQFIITNGGLEPIATTITADDCRDPFFRWYKDGAVVRKYYVDGNGVYEDVITRPPHEWLESCHDYILEVDCACVQSVNKYVVFCNPQDIDFSLTDCNTRFRLNNFVTCEPNKDQEFFIRGGSLDIKFIGSSPPIGQDFISEGCIDAIEYGLSCDPECNKTYNTPCPQFIDTDLETVCDPNGIEFRIIVPTFVQDSSGNSYPVIKLEIAGLVLLPGTSSPIAIGTYNGLLYIEGGCGTIAVTVNESCCEEGPISPITRECDGTVNCTQDIGVTYTLNGVIETNICAAVAALPLESQGVITASKGSCTTIEFTLPPLSSFCCENYSFVVTYIADDKALLQVFNAGGVLTVNDITITGPTVVIITDQGNNEFELENFTAGQNYLVQVHDVTCGTIQDNWVPINCDIQVNLEQTDDCRLVAEVNPQTCECRIGQWMIEITNVVLGAEECDVYWRSDLEGFDALPISGELFLEIDSIRTSLGTVANLDPQIGSFTLPKPASGPGGGAECVQTQVAASLVDDPSFGPCETGQCQSVEVVVTTDGVNIVNDPQWVSYSVIAREDGTTNVGTGIESGGFFGFTGLINAPTTSTTITVSVSALNIDGSTYSGNVTMNIIFAETTVLIPNGLCPPIMPQSNETQIRIILDNLELEDDCRYYEVGQNFIIDRDANYTPQGVQTVLLNPIDPFARDVKFTWRKDGVIVFVEYQEIFSLLPDIYLEQDSDYTVVADCPPCSDVDDKNFCCIPELSFQILECNAAVAITVTGFAGDYVVTVLGINYPITLVAPGISSGVINVPGPFDPDIIIPVSVQVVGTTCQDDYEFTTLDVYVPEFTFTDCNPGTNLYGIVILNAGPGYSTVIISGSGTIAPNGIDIININEASPPVFNVSPPSGTCTSDNILGTAPFSCFVSSSVGPPPLPPSSSFTIPSSGAQSSSIVMSSSGAPPSSAVLFSSSLVFSSSQNTVSSGASSSVSASSSFTTVGACCNISTGVCLELPSASCFGPSVTFLGAGTSCSPNPCPAAPSSTAIPVCTCTFEFQTCGSCGTCLDIEGALQCVAESGNCDPGEACVANGTCFDCIPVI